MIFLDLGMAKHPFQVTTIHFTYSQNKKQSVSQTARLNICLQHSSLAFSLGLLPTREEIPARGPWTKDRDPRTFADRLLSTEEFCCRRGQVQCDRDKEEEDKQKDKKENKREDKEEDKNLSLLAPLRRYSTAATSGGDEATTPITTFRAMNASLTCQQILAPSRSGGNKMCN